MAITNNVARSSASVAATRCTDMTQVSDRSIRTTTYIDRNGAAKLCGSGFVKDVRHGAAFLEKKRKLSDSLCGFSPRLFRLPKPYITPARRTRPPAAAATPPRAGPMIGTIEGAATAALPPDAAAGASVSTRLRPSWGPGQRPVDHREQGGHWRPGRSQA